MKNYSKVIFIIAGVILLLSLFSIFSTNAVKLGEGFIYYSDNKMISNSKGRIGEIPSNVEDYNYDNNFIIAVQKPLDNDPNALLYDFEYKYEEGFNTNYYWIIIKKEKKIIGPLTITELDSIKNRYNVPKKLNFF
ncbi:MAG: DUF3997 domain-containing protein [Chitinophagales bacterium]|nr:DUF3997 domain-containing protein [Chitinophagales bacterium]MBP9190548.1 DUF3997 domain-containing protein [Chitinophagales bacterium]